MRAWRDGRRPGDLRRPRGLRRAAPPGFPRRARVQLHAAGATRVAVEDLDPALVGIGRAELAAVPAALILLATRAPLPSRSQVWRPVGIVASGVVFGWPPFSALALHDLNSAHSAVILGILPAATAVAAVLRACEHPLPSNDHRPISTRSSSAPAQPIADHVIVTLMWKSISRAFARLRACAPAQMRSCARGQVLAVRGRS